jgi:hypothetical protein
MKKWLGVGGIAAGVVLIAFGIGAIAMSVDGRNTVRDSLAAQNITATPDAAELTNGALQPGQTIDTGSEARDFATIMEHHALEATGGQHYAEMGRFLDANGKPTSDEAKAAKDPKTGQPVENGLRNLWVTETALTTALNMSYMAEQLSLFGLVVGVALLLSGVGFVILAVAALGVPALRHREETKLSSAPVV